MRVLVCGSRTWWERTPVDIVLEGYLHASRTWGDKLVVIEGGAKGADAMAAAFAQLELDDVVHERYPADWEKHGKAAGPIRNQQMLDTEPDYVWAFIDKPLEESRGTADIVRRARKAGVVVYVVSSVPSGSSDQRRAKRETI